MNEIGKFNSIIKLGKQSLCIVFLRNFIVTALFLLFFVYNDCKAQRSKYLQGLTYVNSFSFEGFTDLQNNRIIDFKNKKGLFEGFDKNTNSSYSWFQHNGIVYIISPKSGFFIIQEYFNGIERRGVINSKGDVLIPPKYSLIGDYENGCFKVSHLLYAVSKFNGAIMYPDGFVWGYVDTTGKEILKPRYHEIFTFNGGIARVSSIKDKVFTKELGKSSKDLVKYASTSPEDVAAYYFTDTKLSSEKKKLLYGFINFKYEEIIPCVYEGLGDNIHSMIWYSANGKYGYMGINNGAPVFVDPIYEYAEDFKDYSGRFSCLCGKVIKKGKPLLLNKTLQELPGKSNLLLSDFCDDFSEDLALFMWDFDKTGKKYGYVDTSGNEVIKRQFDFAQPFKNGIAKVGIGNSYGYIDKTGAPVIPVIYEDLGEFSEGLVYFRSNDRYGFFNNKGQVAIEPNFDGASDFHDGLARVKKTGGYKYIRTYQGSDWMDSGTSIKKEEVSSDAFGFIDISGNIVIDYNYTSAENFNSGEAKVFLPKVGYVIIDRTGKQLRTLIEK